MKIVLFNGTIINDANVYLNGQYQEELVIQVHNLEYIELLKVFQDKEAFKEIYVYDDSESLVGYYLDFIDVKSIYSADSVITIILSQKTKLNTQFQNFENNISQIKTTIEDLDSQINPVFDWDNSTLEECKEYKISESKNALEDFLFNNHLLSSAHNGKTGYYSVTNDKQILMMSNYLSWQIESATNPDAVLTWNETGKECTAFTEIEYLQLMLEIKNYVYPKVKLQQYYEVQIANATENCEVQNIAIDYSKNLESEIPENPESGTIEETY